MAGDEELSAVACFHDGDSCLVAFGYDVESGHFFYVLSLHLAVSAMGSEELVVEATEDGQFGVEHLVFEDSEDLVGCVVFGHSVEVVQASKSCPADVDGAGDIVVSPVEDFLQLAPVPHLLVVHKLEWGSRDEQSVVLLLLHVFEVAVECHHVLHGCVLAGV